MINYDCYRYDYTCYDGYEGLLTIKSYHEYRDLMSQIVAGSFNFGDDVRCPDSFWGEVDGNAMHRIVSAIQNQ